MYVRSKPNSRPFFLMPNPAGKVNYDSGNAGILILCSLADIRDFEPKDCFSSVFHLKSKRRKIDILRLSGIQQVHLSQAVVIVLDPECFDTAVFLKTVLILCIAVDNTDFRKGKVLLSVSAIHLADLD